MISAMSSSNLGYQSAINRAILPVGSATCDRIRCTVDLCNSNSLASRREEHREPFASSLFWACITRVRTSGIATRGLLPWCRPRNPRKRASMKRFFHKETVGALAPSRRSISRYDEPSARAIIRAARKARALEVECERNHESSSSRSSGVNSRIDVPLAAVGITEPAYHKETGIVRQMAYPL